MAEIIIHPGNWRQFVEPVIDGEKKARGLVPRDFRATPYGSIPEAKPFDIPLIPESEWEDRFRQQVATKSRLSDIRMTGNAGKMIPSRDQDGYGYCWAHSTVSAILLARARDGEPYVDLSAFAIACIIKGFRDQGGWNAESVAFAAERGVPTSQFWAQKSTQRSNDNPQTWENAALHKATDWRDLDPRDMKRQIITCLLLGIPVVGDFNWWGHSVGIADIVSLTPFSDRIWNSWTDSWSDMGMGVLQGSHALPDAAIALISSTASAA